MNKAATEDKASSTSSRMRPVQASPVPTTDLSSIKEQIDRLSAKQRKEIKDYLAYVELKHGSEDRTGDEQRKEMILLDLVQERLTQVLRVKPMPYQIFARTPSYKALQEAIAHLDVFTSSVQTGGALPLSMAKRTALYRLCVSHWESRVNAIGIPLGIKTLLQQAEHTPGLFDKAYPGYLASGLVDWVLSAGSLRNTDTNS